MANKAHTDVPSGTAANESRRWIFGRAVVDERTLELLVDGTEVEIERKPFEVLRFLLQHAGEVVTKEELLSGVWPGRFLSDTVLAKAIGRLREVLDDTDQSIIRTVHGYGYRFVAPLRIEVQHAHETAHFDFKEGDHPPERPLWSLVRRLGSGGHGEAWLGRHDKTREQRVFKFAIDERSLAALKREVTLFRFLNDSIGERARIVPVMDWNLEQPPCFIESEYIAGGSLVEWAEHNGGLAGIPLATRLNIATQIAEAVAAVHSVGVLHKDLKPSNVLISAVSPLPQAGEGQGEGARSADTKLRVLLADFGSGGVLNPRRLEELGITRMGFTRTVAANTASTGGTPLYLAPELLAGQPSTIKADIYALGVMLYQLVVGEFRKVMSPGWEHEVDDELLRADIAQAAEGDVTRRMGSAAELAQRLRTLGERRAHLQAERSAQARLERARLAEVKQRARRAWMLAAGLVLAIGAGVSTALYLDARKSRDEAVKAAAASQAVADFLSKDMFAVVSTKPLRDLTVQELLEAASKNLAAREPDMPEAAAQIHAALGDAFWKMERPEAAEAQLDAALDWYLKSGAAASDSALAAAVQLATVKLALGSLGVSLQQLEQVLAEGSKHRGPDDGRVMTLAQQIAWARFHLGDWRRAESDLADLVERAQHATVPDKAFIGTTQMQRGYVLVSLGQFGAATAALRDAIGRLLAAPDASPLAVGGAYVLLASALIEQEAFADADAALKKAEDLMRPWVVGSNSVILASVHWFRARLWSRQGRYAQAIALREQTIASLESQDWIRTVDHTYEVRADLAFDYRDTRRLDEAESAMRKALDSSQAVLGATHPTTQRIRIGLADIVRRADGAEPASKILAGVDIDALARLGPDHPLSGELAREQGLIASAQGRLGEARARLETAQRIFRTRYGGEHAYTHRAAAELAQVAVPESAKTPQAGATP
ncbi:winged helix-turn-helix domain-containing protein [Fontimonas sp. SYSU GA230001]|uniref:protein kinase domain-containing protein n=1 Tax=Fontimonas sp. SYSU GA230001 TaxID=3142450 RepID=UPI0032B5A04B